VRLNRFDLNLLLALEALLRERSVTRAAERLHISQPAMSAALSKLREYFDDPLLVRVGRDLELTPRGQSLLEPVQQMLLSAHAVLGSQAVFDPSVARRTFRMLVPEELTPWIVPPVLHRLERWAPGIRLKIERLSIDGLARLAQGNLDLALVINSPDSLPVPALPESICNAYVLWVRYVAVVAADHPEVSGELTAEQYLRLPHVVAHAFRHFSLLEETAQKRYGVELDVRAVTQSVLEIPHLVARTSMVGVVPEPLGRVVRGLPEIRVLELPDGVMPGARMDMIWHRSFQPDAGHAWMRGIIFNECSQRTYPPALAGVT
jgi:DNA-binding transcriptional LysR family regulator